MGSAKPAGFYNIIPHSGQNHDILALGFQEVPILSSNARPESDLTLGDKLSNSRIKRTSNPYTASGKENSSVMDNSESDIFSAIESVISDDFYLVILFIPSFSTFCKYMN
jgi:hypothetical protein